MLSLFLSVCILAQANISEVINDKGCADAAIKWVKDNYIVLGGAAFGVVVIEVSHLFDFMYSVPSP